jgi:hypothetical protein
MTSFESGDQSLRGLGPRSAVELPHPVGFAAGGVESKMENAVTQKRRYVAGQQSGGAARNGSGDRRKPTLERQIPSMGTSPD